MTTNQLLARYNQLAGTSLKTWKTSKAELENRIKALETAKTDKVTIAAIAKSYKLNPKVIRARMRRLYASKTATNLPTPISKTRWEFAAADRRRVEELVKAA